MGRMLFIGVGPGDPELITLKAINALKKADRIALPDAGSGSSVIDPVIREWIGDKPLLRLPMPMRGAREEWHSAHQSAAEVLLRALEADETIAYPVLGDPLLYATSGYLLALIEPRFPCEVIPGIPALCASAARVPIPLSEGREPLTILPGYEPQAELPPGNIVVMKAGRTIKDLQQKLLQDRRAAWVVRNLGIEDEWVGPIEAYDAEGKQSYFTTVLVKPAGWAK